jgi:hypothetical protein
MSTTLMSLRSLIGGYLQDPTNLVFDTTAVDGALRLALADYSRVTGTAQTISGLDGAVVTTLSDVDAEAVAIGAAAYTALGRVIKRGESFQFKQAIPKEQRGWGEARLKDFKDLLEQARTGTLRGSTVKPWAMAGWGMDAWDPNTPGVQ